MNNILDHTTFDSTNKALECWDNIPDDIKAQHILGNSPEYAVWVQALENKANITASYEMINNMPDTIAKWANHVPEDVGNA